jgi:hypothetical protein
MSYSHFICEGVVDFDVRDGDVVSADAIPVAVTAAPLRYEDGALQTFTSSGHTTYVEGARRTHGEWSVDESGRFTSFWPPSYRATYALCWLMDDGVVTGLRFVDTRSGARFEGRFQRQS